MCWGCPATSVCTPATNGVSPRAPTTTHGYGRSGTAALFAALNVLEKQILGRCQPRHVRAEGMKLLRQSERDTPKNSTLHLVADYFGTRKHPSLHAWLAKHPRPSTFTSRPPRPLG
jgi:hypothetical protein